MRNMNLIPAQKEQNEAIWNKLVANLYLVENESLYRANSITEAIEKAKADGYNPSDVKEFDYHLVEDHNYQFFTVISQLRLLEKDIDENNILGNIYNSENIKETLESFEQDYLDHCFMLSSIISTLQVINDKLDLRQELIQLLNKEMNEKQKAA